MHHRNVKKTAIAKTSNQLSGQNYSIICTIFVLLINLGIRYNYIDLVGIAIVGTERI